MSKKILLVDDEAGMRRSLAIMLRREHYQVTETGAVAEAVGRLKGERYDLVVADLRMEPLDGFDLLTLARQYADCPVVIVTAFGSPEARAEALRRGAVEFLEKPLDAAQLLARVRELLEGHGG